MKIGVLALQGDFAAHGESLRELGSEAVEVRRPADLLEIDGVVLPGGESTTMLKLIEEEGFVDPLLAFAAQKPVLATCAGVILLARRVSSPEQRSLGVLDLEVERNAYGRQIHSAVRRIEPTPSFVERTSAGAIEAVFIRAPIIRALGSTVTALACDEERPALVEQGRHLAATFHPELTSDRRVHRLFLQKVRENL